MALLVAAPTLPAAAQHWSFDARRIALGNAKDVTSIVSSTVPRRRRYRSIVLPLRLTQVLGDLSIYKPNSDNFDPIRAMTYVISPIHYTFDADVSNGQVRILNDLLRFDLDRDLTTYLADLDINLPDLAVLTGGGRGGGASPGDMTGMSLGSLGSLGDVIDLDQIGDLRVSLADSAWDETYLGEWLFTGNWGRTFTLREDRGGAVHAAYVGAGPYLSFHSDAQADGSFNSYIDVGNIVRSVAEGRLRPDIANLKLQYNVQNDTYAQMAAAVTGGYRARLPFAGRSAAGRDGVYVAVNYNYLHGFRYEDLEMDLELALDSATVGAGPDPANPRLGEIGRLTSRRGRGFALDAGVAVVLDRWDFGAGVTGLMNRITWRDVRRGVLPLFEENLFSGFGDGALDDIRSPGGPPGEDRRVSTPVRYTADVAYHEGTWSVLTNYARGFLGHYVNAGFEYQLPWMDVRAGSRFKRDRWHPAGGVGFKLSPGWHLDVGAFGTSINPQRKRRLALAMSLRRE